MALDQIGDKPLPESMMAKLYEVILCHYVTVS